MRELDFSDGFTSASEPSKGLIESTGLKSFANDAAYEADIGRSGQAGDQYYNTTTNRPRYHNGSAFIDMLDVSNGIDTGTAAALTIGATTATSVELGNAGTTTTVKGNLQVDGTTTTVNSTTLDVDDKNITVSKGGNDAASEGAGLTVERTGTDGSIIYKDASATKFALGAVGSEVDVADISTAQTLTNKTISDASNTISVEEGSIKSTGEPSGNILRADGAGGATWQGFPSTSVNVLNKDANYTMLVTDDMVFCNATTIGSFTITLPSAVGNAGKIYDIKRTDLDLTRTVTIDPDGAETIEGAANKVLYLQNESYRLVSDNVEWKVITHNEPEIAVRYSTDVAQTMTNNTDVRVDFEDLEHETFTGMVTTGASWKFTAPTPGVYRVSAMCSVDSSGNMTINDQINLRLFKAAVQQQNISQDFADGTKSNSAPIDGTTTINLAKDEEINIRISHNMGVDRNLTQGGMYNWVDIYKVK